MDGMTFFDIIRFPSRVMAAEVKNASTKEAMKAFAIYGLVIGLLLGLLVAFFAGLVSMLGIFGSNNGFVALAAGFGLLAIIILPIIFAVISVVGSYISSGIMWLVAKLLGGKGTFEQNYYLFSRLLWPVLVITFLANILVLIPVIGSLIPLVWTLYLFYLYVVVISTANTISKLKALIAFVVPAIIVMVIAFIVAGALVLSLLASANAVTP